MSNATNLLDQSARFEIICGTCGSSHVTRDAWAEWDVATQDWVLGAVFDEGFCHQCEDWSSLAERVID